MYKCIYKAWCCSLTNYHIFFKMLELPFNMTLNFPTLFFKSLPFAKNLEPELFNGAIALVAVGLTAAYIYYRKKPKGLSIHYYIMLTIMSSFSNSSFPIFHFSILKLLFKEFDIKLIK